MSKLDRKITVRYTKRIGHGTWDKDGARSRGRQEKEMELKNVFRM
jgi:hypothetical protein